MNKNNENTAVQTVRKEEVSINNISENGSKLPTPEFLAGLASVIAAFALVIKEIGDSNTKVDLKKGDFELSIEGKSHQDSDQESQD